MRDLETKPRKFFNTSIHAKWTGAALALGVCIGGISLAVIAVRLAPISDAAKHFNRCITAEGTSLRNYKSENLK